MKKCKYCGLEIELLNGAAHWSLSNNPYRRVMYVYTCLAITDRKQFHEPLTETETVAQILSKYEV